MSNNMATNEPKRIWRQANNPYRSLTFWGWDQENNPALLILYGVSIYIAKIFNPAPKEEEEEE